MWVGSQSRNFRETRRERERERGGEKKETAKIQNKPSTKGEHDSKKTEEVRKRDAVCLCCFYFVHCFINVVKLLCALLGLPSNIPRVSSSSSSLLFQITTKYTATPTTTACGGLGWERGGEHVSLSGQRTPPPLELGLFLHHVHLHPSYPH